MWIDMETTSNYIKILNRRDYAIPFWKPLNA